MPCSLTVTWSSLLLALAELAPQAALKEKPRLQPGGEKMLGAARAGLTSQLDVVASPILLSQLQPPNEVSVGGGR